MKDSEGTRIKAGDTIEFCYGIPPILVTAPIVLRRGKLIALTKGHSPSEVELKELNTFSQFYKSTRSEEKDTK